MGQERRLAPADTGDSREGGSRGNACSRSWKDTELTDVRWELSHGQGLVLCSHLQWCQGVWCHDPAGAPAGRNFRTGADSLTVIEMHRISCQCDTMVDGQ